MRIQLLIVLLLFLSTTAMSKTYYVDATAGTDTANGLTEKAAWKTLAQVGAAGFAPGDQILLRRGQTWREQLTASSAGASGSPLTIGAYGATGAAPVISGANVLTGWTAYQGSVWKAPCAVEPHIAACAGVVGQRQTSLTQLAASRDWYWSGGIFYLYAPSRPDQAYASQGVEAAARDYCIYANQKSYLKYTGLTLTWANRSCLRAQGGDHGLQLTDVCARGAGDQGAYEFDACADITLNHCTAEDCRAVTVGDGFMFKGGCSNITLLNCTAAYNRRRGAQFDTGIGGFLHIFGGEFHHQWGLNQSDGISIDANNGVWIEGVWCHDNGINNDSADGIQISGLSRNPVVRYCRLENNYNGGLILNADGGTLAYNISTGNRHGIAICGNPTLELKIFNNTCYNNEFGFFVYQDTSDEILAAAVRVNNNIFYGTDAKRRAISVQSGLNTSQLKLDYNCLWGDMDQTSIKWGAASYARSQIGAYKTATGEDMHSIGSDPLFVNPTAEDFSLKTGSPCIDRGLDLALTRDFAGRTVPVNGRPDIGALEYGANSALSPRVSSISRLDPDPNRNATVRYALTFNEAVTGLNAQDFSLAPGTPGGSGIASLSGDGSQYTVGVGTGSGDGPLQLRLLDKGTIFGQDGVPLGGAGISSGVVAAGPIYRVDRTPPQSQITSIAAQLANGLTSLRIAYTAHDAVGVDYVQLFYRKDNSSTFLHYGGAFRLSPIIFTPTAGKLGAGKYEFYTEGVDLAGNVEAPPTVNDGTKTVSSRIYSYSCVRDWRNYE